MEPNDNNNTNTTTNTNNLSSYFHHFNHQQPPPPPPPPTNGVVVTPTSGDGSHSHMLYPHTTTTSTVVPSAVSSQSQLQKKKRGRPRKYSSPEEALAARKAATTSSSFSPSFSSSSRKSSQSFSLGTAGQDFTPHFITVLAGEDVGQKIMSFMQQHKCEICILSASGFISNASLSQPATSGGSITYEGRFEIVSLNGSYIRNEVGSRSGGLSVCLSNTDGQIIGGGVGGPLKAAGPVQVIVGAFIIDPKKDASAGIKGDVSSSKLPPPVSDPVSSFGFSRPIDSSTGNPIRVTEEHQTIGGSHFNIQQGGMQGTHSRPSDWGGHPDSRNADFELAGRAGQGAHQSSDENGYYD